MTTTTLNPLAADIPAELQERMKAHAAKADAWLGALVEWTRGYVALSGEFSAAIKHHPDVDDYVDTYAGTGWDALDMIETIIFWMQDACEGGTDARWDRALEKVAEIRTRHQHAPDIGF